MTVMIYFTVDKKRYDAVLETDFWHLRYSRSTGSFVCVRGSHPCLHLECSITELMPLIADFGGKLMISILD